MIKLTNNNGDRRGDVLWINTDHIVSVYETASIENGSLSTRIYGSTGTEWIVEESPKQVIAIIANNNMLT